MDKVGLAVEVGAQLQSVGDASITIRKGDAEETVACSALVIAPDRVAHEPFSTALLGSGIKVEVVGDARAPRSYGNAIHEAAYLSRRI